MQLYGFVAVAFSCIAHSAAREEAQAVLHHPEGIKQVAIIGAGAGGAATAYHLSKFASSAGIPINITVFERNPYVGGRSTTVNAYNDQSLPVELGASIFVEVNRILIDAVTEFNLSTASFIPEAEIPGAALAVWDGKEFVVTLDGCSWWDSAKLVWKYGLAPIKTVRLMKNVVGSFMKMYDAPTFPFSSLTQGAQDVGLLTATASTGKQFMEENGITGPFGRDIVQASTRVNYAQNLRYIHGLEAMVCMAAENAQSVWGGNWQIFDRMISAADATLLLETEVTSIEKHSAMQRVHYQDAASAHGRIPQHQLEQDVGDGMATVQHEDRSSYQDFDEVILAAPNQFANISWDAAIDKIPYVQLHVTLFTSPYLLSPAFFNLPEDKPVPRVILTTLPKDEPAQEGVDGVGTPGFFSISLLDPIINPHNGDQEYLYKIFSPTPPKTDFLARLLGSQERFSRDPTVASDKLISWSYRKVWDSYPYEYPRVTFEEIKLGEGLWYTSGMDSFISTMETNALMGKNVARLIVDQWQDKTKEMQSLAEMEQPTLLPEANGL